MNTILPLIHYGKLNSFYNMKYYTLEPEKVTEKQNKFYFD